MDGWERLDSLERRVAKLIELAGLQAAEIEHLKTEVRELRGDAAVAWIERDRVKSAFSGRG
jgi:hypothetical protein